MNTIVGYVYDMLYGNGGGYPSYASAAAIILFAIVLTITCINLLVSKKHVHYCVRCVRWRQHFDFESNRDGRCAGKILTYALLTIWALIVLFPFYWMLLTSVKDYSAYNSEYIPTLFTLAPTLENYKEAFTAVPLARYFANTIIFTVVTTALMLAVTVLAAFAFARLQFRGKDLTFTLFWR